MQTNNPSNYRKTLRDVVQAFMRLSIQDRTNVILGLEQLPAGSTASQHPSADIDKWLEHMLRCESMSEAGQDDPVEEVIIEDCLAEDNTSEAASVDNDATEDNLVMKEWDHLMLATDSETQSTSNKDEFLANVPVDFQQIMARTGRQCQERRHLQRSSTNNKDRAFDSAEAVAERVHFARKTLVSLLSFYWSHTSTVITPSWVVNSEIETVRAFESVSFEISDERHARLLEGMIAGHAKDPDIMEVLDEMEQGTLRALAKRRESTGGPG